MSAITMAGLSAGPHAAAGPEERARRQDRLHWAEAAFDPLPFDSESLGLNQLPVDDCLRRSESVVDRRFVSVRSEHVAHQGRWFSPTARR